MPKVQLRKATTADCQALAIAMRAADALEAKRSCGLGPLEVLLRSVDASDGRAGALLLDGKLACIYGLVKADVITPVAVPWLLTSNVVEQNKKTFLRIARVVVDRWAEEFPYLVQMVDKDYGAAQFFLQKLKFRIYPPVPHGPEGALFCPAVRTKCVSQ